MNNFYITVSNGLLTSDHRERIGASIWEFLWLLDKITKVDDVGDGWILGGKPINLSDLAEQMGTAEMTVSRNLHRLEDQGYIKLIRTPYGLSIRVKKAKKRFNKNDVSNGKKRSNKDVDSPNINVESPNENVESNKTVSVDIKEDITDTAKIAESKVIIEVINAFKEVNPSFGRWYSRPPQRESIKRLLKVHERDKLLRVIALLPKTNTIPYFPTITSPIQLEEKWASLESALIKKKTEVTKKENNYIS